MKSFQAVRGMRDLLPTETPYWQKIERVIANITAAYGYQEIRLPLLEVTDLFKRTIGEATDIVEKEMYTFADRNGDSLTLRPEGTAGCARAGIQQGLFYNQVQRLWYLGPMFRHERPQKGRYRQFYQFGVEVVGLLGPLIDAEVILLSARLLNELGLKQNVTLQLNSLGSMAARNAYRERLVAYLQQHRDVLDEDSTRRLTTNPLRVLDSKNPAMKTMIAEAPKLIEHLDDASRAHFDTLCNLLTAAGISYEINPYLVRGLDYYNGTVFEWVTTALGAQGTVCAGGRYDSLIGLLGGKDTPAIGFGAGLDRLVELLMDKSSLAEVVNTPQIYLVHGSGEAEAAALVLAENLRTQLPGLQILMDNQGGAFKNQFKRADKSGAHLALVLGETEHTSQQVGVKNLREQTSQQLITQDKLVDYLRKSFQTEFH